ncbi:MAG: DNA mismatch repair protein MutS [Clostridia bacterium]
MGTAVFEQYLSIKGQYPDCILFFRLGDFYEMYREDAEIASNLLDLTLTARSLGEETRTIMCGIPFHSAQKYINKLVSCGYKVAICEQTPSINDKLACREVVKVVTKGTNINDLVEDRNNFIASIYLYDNNLGCAICDVSTGEFNAYELNDLDSLDNLLVSFAPNEIISNSYSLRLNDCLSCILSKQICKITPYYDYAYNYKTAKEIVDKNYNSDRFNFSINGRKFAFIACGSLLSYLINSHKCNLNHITKVNFKSNSTYMSLDSVTRRNLEISLTLRDGRRKGSLIDCLDMTCTNAGARMLVDWIERPLQNIEQINYRLFGVEELVKLKLQEQLKQTLTQTTDIQRAIAKISCNSFSVDDCLSIKNSLKCLPSLLMHINHCNSNIIKDIITTLHGYEEVDKFFSLIFGSENTFAKGYNVDIDQAYDELSLANKQLHEYEDELKTSLQIKTLKVCDNKNYGIYIEIPKKQSNIPEDFSLKSSTTAVNRYVTQYTINLEHNLRYLTQKVSDLEQKLFAQFRAEFESRIPILQQIAISVATIDCLNSFAFVAVIYNYVLPNIVEPNQPLIIVDGRHAVVERNIEKFVPNSLIINQARTIIVTGPNMAGKSTFLRQNAIIVLLAHIGSFVPCTKAQIPLTDKIFTRVGAIDDISLNKSTFMVEMLEVKNILSLTTNNSLILLDEIGKETSTQDGLSISDAILEHITYSIKAKTIFSTHFHKLVERYKTNELVKCYQSKIEIKDEHIKFLYHIAEGISNKSYGIEIASQAGIAKDIILRAKELTRFYEN